MKMRVFPAYHKGMFQCYRFDGGVVGNAKILSEGNRPHNFTHRDTGYMFVEQNGQIYLFLSSEKGMWHGEKISDSQYNKLKDMDFEEIAEYYYENLN